MPALSPLVRKLAAAAVVVVSAGVMVAGVVTVSVAPASGQVAQDYQTDHQLCYSGGGSGSGVKLPPPGSVTLVNQFGGFKPAFLSSDPVLHCNPVEKILPDGQDFPVTNPSAHALCWKISGDTTKQPLVAITTQFGSGNLLLGQASLLCLPSWKSLAGPPGMASSQPPGLSHYACYPVLKVTSGGYTAPGLELKDEFAVHPVQARLTSFAPTQLCVPTTKIVVTPAGTKVYPVVPGASQLLCFPVTQTPIRTPVFDQNQFTGPGVRITIAKTLTLCVPSISPHLYWADFGGNVTNGGTIMKANADGTGVTILETGQNSPVGVAVDSSHVYWTNSGGGTPGIGTIMEANPDGTGVTTLITGQDHPVGMTVDSSHIYWANSFSGTIMRANLDGTGVTTLETGQDSPEWVAVDSSHIYWSDTPAGTIMWANLDGTGATTLETGQNFPAGLAVDGSHIYWANGLSGTIVRANLDGTGVTTLVTGQNGPLGLAVDSSHIYWVNGLSGMLVRANLDGTGVTTLVTGQNRPDGVAVGP